MIFENTWIITSIIGAILLYLAYFVRLIRSYPRGPIPLPIIGNVLHFRGKYTDPTPLLKMGEWAKQYGPMYTIWVGHKPIVVINNYELNTEANVTKRNNFVDRMDSLLHEIARNGGHNIVNTNGPYWEALRKVAVFAIRRFMNSERLSEIACEATDDSMSLMAKHEQPFDPILHIDYIIFNVMAIIAFNQKFDSIEDKSLKDAKKLNDEFYEVMGNGLITDFIPWLKPFYRRVERLVREMAGTSVESIRQMFNEHKQSYQQGIIRDFSDCVLEAKEEAIRENFSRSQFLNDDNLYNIIFDLFQAGTDTTQTTLRWAVLQLANDPLLQEEIHKEISDNIGDRRASQEDKEILPLTYALLLEVLRLRAPAPIGMEHMASVDTELGGHKLPKGTVVLFNLYAQNTDPKYWSEPLRFNPKRFFDGKGKVLTGKIPSFVTFGLGRRACPGERLALNMVFLILCRLMQKVRLELSTGAGTANLTPINVLLANFPIAYKVTCTLR